MASAILVDINTRFSPYFTFTDATQSAALASITHPAFKLRWIKPANVEQMKNLFLNTLRFSSEREHQQNAMMPSRTDEMVDSKTLDFFSIMADADGEPGTTLHSQAELQGLQYLEDSDRALSMLGRYPLVRSMFRKFNVGLPSSAAVERLFSVGGMICTVKRNRLSPQLFEKLLLQCVNNRETHKFQFPCISCSDCFT